MTHRDTLKSLQSDLDLMLYSNDPDFHMDLYAVARILSSTLEIFVKMNTKEDDINDCLEDVR